jgi:hypothetical protein
MDTVRAELAGTEFYNMEWLAVTWNGIAEAWYWSLGLMIPVLLAVFWQRLTEAVWTGWDQSATVAVVEGDEKTHYVRRLLLWFVGLLPVYCAVRYTWYGGIESIYQDVTGVLSGIWGLVDGYFSLLSRLSRWMLEHWVFFIVIPVIALVVFGVYSATKDKNA